MPNPNDMITVRIVARFDAEPVINNISFAVVNPEATYPDQVTILAGELDTALGLISGGGDWTSGLSVQYVVEQIQFVDVFPGTNPMHSVASAAAGTVADEDAMPPNDSLCCTLRTDFRGPGGRGRIYLGGFAEGSANGGYWEAGAQSHASTVMADLQGNFGEAADASCRWSVLHKTSNGGVKGAPVVPLVPPTIHPVMSFTVHNEVRSLGRRAVGRRIHRRRTA